MDTYTCESDCLGYVMNTIRSGPHAHRSELKYGRIQDVMLNELSGFPEADINSPIPEVANIWLETFCLDGVAYLNIKFTWKMGTLPKNLTKVPVVSHAHHEIHLKENVPVSQPARRLPYNQRKEILSQIVRRFRVPIDILYGTFENTESNLSLQSYKDNLNSMYDTAREHMNQRQARYAAYHDKNVIDDKLSVGDYVYVYLPRLARVKLIAKWNGPFKIIRASHPVYSIEIPSNKGTLIKTVTRDKLKRAPESVMNTTVLHVPTDDVTNSQSSDEIFAESDSEEELDEPRYNLRPRRNVVRYNEELISVDGPMMSNYKLTEDQETGKVSICVRSLDGQEKWISFDLLKKLVDGCKEPFKVLKQPLTLEVAFKICKENDDFGEYISMADRKCSGSFTQDKRASCHEPTDTPITKAQDAMFSHMVCSACGGIPEDAVETSCCHNVFCAACLQALADQACSFCNSNFLICISHVTRRIVGTLPTQCSHSGCTETMPKSSMKEHIANCQYRPSRCLFKECNEVCLQKDLSQHLFKVHEDEVIRCVVKCNESEELDRMATEKNENGDACHRGKTGKFYCGKPLDDPDSGPGGTEAVGGRIDVFLQKYRFSRKMFMQWCPVWARNRL
eukprot:gene15776-7075_t